MQVYLCLPVYAHLNIYSFFHSSIIIDLSSCDSDCRSGFNYVTGHIHASISVAKRVFNSSQF